MTTTLKTIASLLLLTCIGYNSAHTQTTNLLRVGIKGGVNFSNLFVEDADNTKMLTGFNLGLFAKVPITSIFAIQTELYYTTKGAEITYNNTFVNGSANFSLNYLELPVLLMVNISPCFNVHAGPYAAYLLSGKVKNESNVNLFDFEEGIDTDDYNKLDAGIAVGAGIDIKNVGFGIRYNYGLTKVGKERDFLGTSYTFPDANNSVLNLYISLAFN